MDKRENLHKRISELLLLIESNNNRLYLHEERLPQLEVDLLRTQTIELYACINKLAIAGESKSEDILQSIPKSKKAVAKNPVKVKTEFPEVELEEDEIKEEEPILVKEKPKPKKKAKPKAASSKPSSLYEKYKMQADELSVAEKFRSKPISDLNKVIGISQKFEFQQNLFGGDKAAYKTFIQNINTAGELEGALDLFVEQEKHYNWENGKLKTALKELIYRRFTIKD